jgi:hypothetical protein
MELGKSSATTATAHLLLSRDRRQEQQVREYIRGRERKAATMGCRSCDKPKMNYRKGLWSPEEDQRLRDYILKHGLGCWSAVPAKAGKSSSPILPLS